MNAVPVMNLDEIQFTRDIKHGDRFEARVAPIGARLGACKLGYNVTAVAPGKRAFPFHNHHANEEMFLILEGEGTLRFGRQERKLRRGDVICCPCGGIDVAHQIVNSGASELRYLAVSTAVDTDVYQYPDSGKFGAVGGRQPGAALTAATFTGKFVPESAAVDYWDGE